MSGQTKHDKTAIVRTNSRPVPLIRRDVSADRQTLEMARAAICAISLNFVDTSLKKVGY